MAIDVAKFQNVLAMGNRIYNFGFFLTMAKMFSNGNRPT